jgi:hypothetical protein
MLSFLLLKLCDSLYLWLHVQAYFTFIYFVITRVKCFVTIFCILYYKMPTHYMVTNLVQICFFIVTYYVNSYEFQY